MTGDLKKYETERTRKWRRTDLHPTDERTIGQIEQTGCSVISVGRDCKDDLSWTYTIGVNDTSGKPDLITVGLNFKVAQSCLNEAVRRMREGADLTIGRHSEMIGNVDCELRPVDPKWVRCLMNWANWYYEGTEYPVLQVVYPDLKNKFPGEFGFDERFARPMMQPGVPFTEVERKFWGSIANDEERFPDWKFADKPHTKVFISKAVQDGEEWIDYVSHDLSDGAWQFVGETGIERGGPVLACLHHVLEKDPTLADLADMPAGWYAERENPGAMWIKYPYEEEEADEAKS